MAGLFRPLAEFPGGHATPDFVWGDRTRNDGPGGDDRTASDHASVEQDGIRANPHIVLNNNTSFGLHEALVANDCISRIEGVVRGNNLYPRRQKNVVTESDPISTVKHAPGIDIAVLSNNYITFSPDAADNHVIVNLRMLSKDYPVSANGLVNNRGIRNEYPFAYGDPSQRLISALPQPRHLSSIAYVELRTLYSRER